MKNSKKHSKQNNTRRRNSYTTYFQHTKKFCDPNSMVLLKNRDRQINSMEKEIVKIHLILVKWFVTKLPNQFYCEGKCIANIVGTLGYQYGRKINLPTASYVVLSTVDLKAHKLKCKSHTYKTFEFMMRKSFILG